MDLENGNPSVTTEYDPVKVCEEFGKSLGRLDWVGQIPTITKKQREINEMFSSYQ